MSELPFVWQNWAWTEEGAPLANLPWPQFRFPRWIVTEKDREMGEIFARFWTNLAYTRATPNSGGAGTHTVPHWPLFAATNGSGDDDGAVMGERVLMLDVPTHVEAHDLQQRARCDFWDDVERRMADAYV